MIDLKNFDPRACGFIGGCYDGRYLYLAPYFDGTRRFGQVARYDSRQPVHERNSWEFFDTETVHPESRGFFGAFVDQSFVYFVPHCKAEAIYHGQITRYDRRQPFLDPAAWSVCDTTAYHPMSKGYIGGALKDDYLYLAPYETAPSVQSGLIVRINLTDKSVWHGQANECIQ